MAGRRLLVLLAWLSFCAAEQHTGDGAGQPATPNTTPITAKENLQYGVEWRLVRAGLARVTWTPALSSYQGGLHLESAGLVSKLYKVNDDYVVNATHELCADNVLLKAEEGKRNRETKITFDRARSKSHYLERDVVKIGNWAPGF